MGFGPDRQSAFDRRYGARLMNVPRSRFQRSYAHVLANGLDAVNDDRVWMKYVRENFTPSATLPELLLVG